MNNFYFIFFCYFSIFSRFLKDVKVFFLIIKISYMEVCLSLFSIQFLFHLDNFNTSSFIETGGDRQVWRLSEKVLSGGFFPCETKNSQWLRRGERTGSSEWVKGFPSGFPCSWPIVTKRFSRARSCWNFPGCPEVLHR